MGNEIYKGRQNIKSPARLFRHMREALRLGGEYILWLPHDAKHWIVVARKQRTVMGFLVNDKTSSANPPTVIFRLEHAKTSLQAVAAYLFSLRESKDDTKALVNKANGKDEVELTKAKPKRSSKPKATKTSKATKVKADE